MSSIVDNFKGAEHAECYAKYRQCYPAGVYEKIIEYLKSGSESNEDKVDVKYKLAVDVGCGSGQGTLPLCKYFHQVIAVDTSEAQIDQAKLKVGQGEVEGQCQVTFRVGDGQDLSFLSDNSVDLITVAVAIHWFDVEKFCLECRRVLRAGGVLAAYCYDFGVWKIGDTGLGQEITDTYLYLCTEYADAHLQHMPDKYTKIFDVFPKVFPNTKRDDSVTLTHNYSLEGVQGYFKTLSPYWKMRKARPDLPDPVETVRDAVLKAYNNSPPQDAVTLYNEFFIIMGKK